MTPLRDAHIDAYQRVRRAERLVDIQAARRGGSISINPCSKDRLTARGREQTLVVESELASHDTSRGLR